MADFLANNFGLAIIALTIIINLILLPMTLSQIRSSKAMQDMQPKLAELQKKYAKDKQKLAEEQMALYKSSGIKPAGCLLTMIIQMPVWIALYQAILLVLAITPEGLMNLSRFLYSWDIVYTAVPLGRSFIGLDLAQPNMILALFVGVFMWVQNKMTTNPNMTDPQQAAQAQMMQWMMPIMFAIISMSVPSGLALYWVVNSIFRIVLQYKISGLGGLKRTASKETPAGQKHVKFDKNSHKQTTVDGTADIIIKDEQSQQITNQPSYLPGKRNKKKK
jgi:YidC/Oxa1 family membrane protein insertase